MWPPFVFIMNTCSYSDGKPAVNATHRRQESGFSSRQWNLRLPAPLSGSRSLRGAGRLRSQAQVHRPATMPATRSSKYSLVRRGSSTHLSPDNAPHEADRTDISAMFVLLLEVGAAPALQAAVRAGRMARRRFRNRCTSWHNLQACSVCSTPQAMTVTRISPPSSSALSKTRL